MIYGRKNFSTSLQSTSTGKIEVTLRIIFAYSTNSLLSVSHKRPGSLIYVIIASFVYTFGLISLYYAAYSTRKKISLAKRLGEEAGTRWETFCSDFELGQAATINFVSSCLMTNDRVYLVLRLILAVWSFTITLSTFAGARSLILGAYFPLATILTVHINLKRHLIVEGFGTKMQSVNKFLHWLFSCQVSFF